ncbi:hypothetical protein PQ469_05980 [Mucilaginibacter sp. KACC 22773]|uniref:hypothetical protein n=1 Tax=Mucilaginibacter sp. KACC 22773 TaxID=3025671 RepID=UPI0023658582|nr:hypothetical protein [Mucilaginibacter sp. KACC 22773]WDF79551.1 hypothetical protein PQ469_05980 [Mucilaginibacter sp. KACC 22773]
MGIEEIKIKLIWADFAMAGRLVGVSSANARNAFMREGSPHHQRVLKALTMVIENREKLLSQTVTA